MALGFVLIDESSNPQLTRVRVMRLGACLCLSQSTPAKRGAVMLKYSFAALQLDPLSSSSLLLLQTPSTSKRLQLDFTRAHMRVGPSLFLQFLWYSSAGFLTSRFTTTMRVYLGLYSALKGLKPTVSSFFFILTYSNWFQSQITKRYPTKRENHHPQRSQSKNLGETYFDSTPLLDLVVGRKCYHKSTR